MIYTTCLHPIPERTVDEDIGAVMCRRCTRVVKWLATTSRDLPDCVKTIEIRGRKQNSLTVTTYHGGGRYGDSL